MVKFRFTWIPSKTWGFELTLQMDYISCFLVSFLREQERRGGYKVEWLEGENSCSFILVAGWLAAGALWEQGTGPVCRQEDRKEIMCTMCFVAQINEGSRRPGLEPQRAGRPPDHWLEHPETVLQLNFFQFDWTFPVQIQLHSGSQLCLKMFFMSEVRVTRHGAEPPDFRPINVFNNYC